MTPITNETEPLYSSLSSDPDLRKIVDLFVEEIPGRVAAMLEQLESSDWEGLRRSAHQLKGSAGSYGYMPISDCAALLEEAVHHREREEQIREAVNVLTAICKRARGGAGPD